MPFGMGRKQKPDDDDKAEAASVEEAAAASLMQSAADRLQKSAEEDQALQAQLAQTQYTRARAKMYNGSKGMSVGQDSNRTIARHIANRGGTPYEGAFYGKTEADAIGIMGEQASRYEADQLEHRAAKADQAFYAKQPAGTLPYILPEDAVTEQDMGKDPEAQYEDAPQLIDASGKLNRGRTAGATPGSKDHPVEQAYGKLDDIVKQHGYGFMMQEQDTEEDAIRILARQLEARRMREMGLRDPSASGGTY